MPSTVIETGELTFTAGENLEAYTRVKLSSDGESVVYADAYDRHIGWTKHAKDNGHQVVVKLDNRPGNRRMIADGAITKGSPVYAADNGKVSATYAARGFLIGLALTTVTADGQEVLVQQERGGEELLFNAVAQSAATGTSSTSEHDFDTGLFILPAGQTRKGDVFKFEAVGTLPSTNGADTFTGRFKINSTTICTTPTPDAVNGDTFRMRGTIEVRDAVASGKIIANGWVLNDALAAGLDTPFNLAEATLDLTVALTIKATGQFSGNSASNEARLQQFSVSRLRK